MKEICKKTSASKATVYRIKKANKWKGKEDETFDGFTARVIRTLYNFSVKEPQDHFVNEQTNKFGRNSEKKALERNIDCFLLSFTDNSRTYEYYVLLNHFTSNKCVMRDTSVST